MRRIVECGYRDVGCCLLYAATCCVLRVAFCVLRPAACVLRAACCVLRVACCVMISSSGTMRVCCECYACRWDEIRRGEMRGVR